MIRIRTSSPDLVLYRRYWQVTLSWRGRPRVYCLSIRAWNQLGRDA